jgi:hypothetical protein
MIDLYTIHEEKVQKGFLSIHPSRWLSYCKFGSTGVLDFPSPEKKAAEQPLCMIDDQIIRYFNELRALNLKGKMYQKSGHYFATSEVADRYAKHVPSKPLHECAIQDMLSIRHPDGRVEVHTPVGYVDFLLPVAIVEVKGLAKWKHALGQVLAYSTFYPGRAKVVHLYTCSNKEPELKATLNKSTNFTD